MPQTWPVVNIIRESMEKRDNVICEAMENLGT
jgi:hypothetical protein